MSVGIIGQKCGMTRVFTPEGESIPVTVIEIYSPRITQVKTLENDGYRAVQVTAGKKRASKINKAMAGHYAKANTEAGKGVWEFRLNESETANLKVGEALNLDMFQAGQAVDVTGISKGKGFAGTVKRHNFATQDATHGNSLSHRVPGSIGQRQTPGRVFPGKKMSGHLGNEKCTVQNQKIIKIDLNKNIILVSGGVPGAPGELVIVKPSVKRKNKRGDK